MRRIWGFYDIWEYDFCDICDDQGWSSTVPGLIGKIELITMIEMVVDHLGLLWLMWSSWRTFMMFDHRGFLQCDWRLSPIAPDFCLQKMIADLIRDRSGRSVIIPNLIGAGFQWTHSLYISDDWVFLRYMRISLNKFRGLAILLKNEN